MQESCLHDIVKEKAYIRVSSATITAGFAGNQGLHWVGSNFAGGDSSLGDLIKSTNFCKIKCNWLQEVAKVANRTSFSNRSWLKGHFKTCLLVKQPSVVRKDFAKYEVSEHLKKTPVSNAEGACMEGVSRMNILCRYMLHRNASFSLDLSQLYHLTHHGHSGHHNHPIALCVEERSFS